MSAMIAEIAVKAKIDAEAPLNLRALIQIARPPTIGPILPTR